MFPGTPFSYSPRQGQRYDLPRCNPAQINSILFMSLLPSVPSFELTIPVGEEMFQWWWDTQQGLLNVSLPTVKRHVNLLNCFVFGEWKHSKVEWY